MTRHDTRAPRVAVIGLDAAEWWLVERYMDEDVMPRLASLRRHGVTLAFDATGQRSSGRVWERFLTGADEPMGACVFVPATYQVAQLGARRIPPFFARIPGLEVLALDVPYMSLWDDVKGTRVTSWGGHDSGHPRASSPRGLLREIDARFGTHPAFNNDYDCGWSDPRAIEKLTRALVTGALRRADVLCWLMQRQPDWDLLLTVMSEGHSAGEFFWHGVDATHPLSTAPGADVARRCLRDTFAAMDAALGKIVDALPAGTTIAVTSVHGMQNNELDLASQVLIPELVYRWSTGRTRFRDEDPGALGPTASPAVQLGPGADWHIYMKERYAFPATSSPRAPWLGRIVRGIRRRLLRRAKPHADLGAPIPPELDVPPSEISPPRYPMDWSVPMWYQDDWPALRAFALPSFHDARVRLNVEGRERAGVVHPRDYGRVLDELTDVLREARNPRTGHRLVGNVTCPGRADPFSMKEGEADIQLDIDGVPDALTHPRFGTIGPFPFRRTGSHSKHGFAIVHGTDLRPADSAATSPLDITATIVSLLDREPIPGLHGKARL